MTTAIQPPTTKPITSAHRRDLVEAAVLRAAHDRDHEADQARAARTRTARRRSRARRGRARPRRRCRPPRSLPSLPLMPWPSSRVGACARSAVGAAVRARSAGCRGPAGGRATASREPSVLALCAELGLGLDRPPDHPADVGDRELEDHQHEDDFPDHKAAKSTGRLCERRKQRRLDADPRPQRSLSDRRKRQRTVGRGRAARSGQSRGVSVGRRRTPGCSLRLRRIAERPPAARRARWASSPS